MQLKLRALALAFIVSLSACQTNQAANSTVAAAIPADDEAFLIRSAASDFGAHVAATGVSFRNVHPGVTHSDGGPPFSALCGEFRANGDAAQWRSFAILRMSDYEMWFGPSAYCQRANTALETRRDLTATLRQQYQTEAGH